MAYNAKIVRLSMELGLAVNDYNSNLVKNTDDIVRTTLDYLTAVKEGFNEGFIKESELAEFFALVGQSWASILRKKELTKKEEK